MENNERGDSRPPFPEILHLFFVYIQKLCLIRKYSTINQNGQNILHHANNTKLLGLWQFLMGLGLTGASQNLFVSFGMRPTMSDH